MKNIKSIPICSHPTREDMDQWMTKVGQPVIIRGAMEDWKARNIWTFDYFRRNFGDEILMVAGHILAERSPVRFRVSLKGFIDYILQPEKGALARLEKAMGLSEPLYSQTFSPFVKYPELLDDFALPTFIRDWVSQFSQPFLNQNYPFRQGYIFFGAKGVVTELHQDAAHMIAWLAQLQGVKRCTLFSPLDSDHLYEGITLEEARNRPITAYEGLLEPGDMIFLPPDWWHHVTALSPSITLSYLIVNHTNFGDYLAATCGDRLPQYLAKLASASQA